MTVSGKQVATPEVMEGELCEYVEILSLLSTSSQVIFYFGLKPNKSVMLNLCQLNLIIHHETPFLCQCALETQRELESQQELESNMVASAAKVHTTYRILHPLT